MPKSYNELEQELHKLETQQNCLLNDVTQINSEILSIAKKASTPIKAVEDGYVIGLDFSSNSQHHLCEWSDKTHGWRKRGLGTRYSSQQEANQRLATLKNKWPNYPLKIIES